MPATRVQATGSGQLRFRVVVEGWPFEFVSSSDDAGVVSYSASNIVERLAGLETSGWVFADKTDLISATAEGEPVTVTLVDIGGRITEALDTQPTQVGYLAGDIDDADTTIPVIDNTVWTDYAKYLYIGRERILADVPGGGITTSLEVVRGLSHSTAVYHYASGSEGTQITDYPIAIEGRRVEFYAYGPGDSISSTDADDPFWIGIVSSSPSYDGTKWEFAVDSLLKRFDQKIGGDLADPAPIRGIYYPAGAPLTLTIVETGQASYLSTTIVASTTFAMAGFWENQEAFVTALTAEIATQMANPIEGAFTQVVTAAISADGGWELRFVTAATPHYMGFRGYAPGGALSYIDGVPSIAPVADGAEVGTVSASTSYSIPLRAPSGVQLPGTVPRAVYGITTLGEQMVRQLIASGDISRLVNMSEDTYPSTRIYIGGRVALVTAATSALIQWAPNGAGVGVETPVLTGIRTSDGSERWIKVALPSPARRSFVPLIATAANVPSIRFGRDVSQGTLADLIDDLRTNSKVYAALGAYPVLRSDDFDTTSLNQLGAAALTNVITSQRYWSVFDENDLSEIVAQELRLLGWTTIITATGKIGFAPIRLASLGESSDIDLTESDFLGQRGAWIRYEIAPYGQVNQWSLKTGYNPLTGDHEGDTIVVVDQESRSTTGGAREIEITPYSITGNGGFDVLEACRSLATRVLAVFGGPYRVLSVRVPLTRWTSVCGNVVRITWAKMPNGQGTLGVTSKAGVIVSRSMRPRDGKIDLRIIVTDQRIAGYAPSAKISTIDSGASGGTGPFTCSLSTDYFESGDVVADHWEAGDKIRVFKWNDSTPGTVTGTVSSLSGLTATQIKFTTDAAWTHAGSTWVVGSQVSTSVSSSKQKLYAYIATATGKADFSDEDLAPYTLQ